MASSLSERFLVSLRKDSRDYRFCKQEMSDLIVASTLDALIMKKQGLQTVRVEKAFY